MVSGGLKLVVTIPGLHPEAGGPARCVPQLCTAMGRQGASIDMVSVDLGSRFGDPLIPPAEFVHTHLAPCTSRVALSLRCSSAFSALLRRRCDATSAEVLHDNGLWSPPNHVAAKVARKLRLPLVLSPQGMLSPWALKHKKWKKKVAWWIYQKRDAQSAVLLQATSSQEAAWLRAAGLRQPIAVVPNGVEPLAASINQSPNSGRLTSSSASHTALFLSRIHPVKGLLDLVEAWHQLRPKGWRVLIAGTDEENHESKVRQAVAERGLSQTIEFVGPVPDSSKWEFYAAADLFVLPTRTENFGIVVAEALAAGTPVITTYGAPWQELETHRCGWWIPVGVEPLIKALQLATSISNGDRRQMGARGQALIAHHYSWESVASKMLTVYSWVAGRGVKPACIIEN